jgi:hypothetical protein
VNRNIMPELRLKALLRGIDVGVNLKLKSVSPFVILLARGHSHPQGTAGLLSLNKVHKPSFLSSFILTILILSPKLTFLHNA